MSRPNPLIVLWLFARTALQRWLNIQVIGLAGLKKSFRKKSAEEEPAASRVATVRRKDRSPLGLRLLGALCLSFLVFLGVAGALRSLGAVIATIQAKDAIAGETMLVASEDYARLTAAAALATPEARRAAAEEVFQDLVNADVSPSLAEAVRQAALERFEDRGLKGFEPAPAEGPWRGSLALCAPQAREEALRAAGVYLLLVNLLAIGCALGMRMGAGHNTEPAADSLEWLFQFPVSRPLIFLAKLVESMFDAPWAMLTGTLTAGLLWHCGWEFAPALGVTLLFALAAAICGASLKLTLEVYLTQTCSRKTQATVVAITSAVGGLGLVALVLYGHNPLIADFVRRLAVHSPAWLLWNPFSLGIGADVRLVTRAGGWCCVAPALALTFAAKAIWLATSLTARGLASGQESVRGSKERRGAFLPALDGMFAGLAWKELLQFRRQRELLAAALLAPLVTAMTLVLMNPEPLSSLASYSGAAICTAIFGGVAYMLFMAASSTLSGELSTLWLLQCQPRSLADCLLVKARVWAAVAACLVVVLSAAAMAVRPDEWLAILLRAPAMMLFLGLLAESIFGLVALGATIANERTVRLSRAALILPGVILADCALAVYVGGWWTLSVQLLMAALLNAAVRQKLRAEVHWLTEPAESPPKTLYAMHGVLAVMSFLVLQQFLLGALANSGLSSAQIVAFSCAASSAAVAAGIWLWQRRTGVRVLPEHAGAGPWRVVAAGTAASVAWMALSSVALYEIQGGAAANPLREALTSSGGGLMSWDFGLTAALLALVAPLFEEWVFRGMLYNGLRKSWGVAPSAAVTILLFLSIHAAAASTVTIIGLAVATTLAMERTKRLWPCVLIHAGYNAVVLLAWHT